VTYLYKRCRTKVLARQAVSLALNRGQLTRPTTCSRCAGKGRIQAHHESYERQLDVTWLCAPCHTARHVALRADARRAVVS
jgi:DnaJ-class molecular chaperone